MAKRVMTHLSDGISEVSLEVSALNPQKKLGGKATGGKAKIILQLEGAKEILDSLEFRQEKGSSKLVLGSKASEGSGTSGYLTEVTAWLPSGCALKSGPTNISGSKVTQDM